MVQVPYRDLQSLLNASRCQQGKKFRRSCCPLLFLVQVIYVISPVRNLTKQYLQDMGQNKQGKPNPAQKKKKNLPCEYKNHNMESRETEKNKVHLHNSLLLQEVKIWGIWGQKPNKKRFLISASLHHDTIRSLTILHCCIMQTNLRSNSRMSSARWGK